MSRIGVRLSLIFKIWVSGYLKVMFDLESTANYKYHYISKHIKGTDELIVKMC